MKKIKTRLILLITLCYLFVVTTASAYTSDTVVSLTINDPIMEVNGTETEIDAGCTTTPVILSGRTLVPIRAIIEAFDGSVSWDETTRSVYIIMGKDTMVMTIDSQSAFLNNKPYTLDVAPTIINGRTMLPVRFVAEGFNLGVAWDEDTATISIIRNSFDDEEYYYLMSILPQYSGNAYTVINNNVPFFKEYEIIDGAFEYYSSLDELGRCDVCMASVDKSIMPTEKRESISSVKPTGWINKSYDIISGGYLYNRCHLIGYQLTGENANKRNLITGTRYLNTDGMLDFENMVDDYIENTGNSVMYRSTPVFSGNNLVADGVLLEAYSVEDNGKGICFCVYCYNVQPGITIDYLTGDSFSEQSYVPSYEPPANSSAVYKTPTGKRYHKDSDCGGVNSYPITLDEALSYGLTPCAKCAD